MVAQMVKNPPAILGYRFDPWVGKIPWRRAWQPTPVFLPGKPTDRGVLLSIISRSIHVAANGIILFFYGRVIFHCIYMYHILFCFYFHYSRRWIEKDTAEICVKECLPMFSSESVTGSGSTFRSWIHSEFPFVHH